MIINELGLCPTRSNNVYFANNEQASLAFTDVFCFAHAEHNLIKLKLYNNSSAQAVNNILESAMWNSKQINQIHHLETSANQSMLNKAHVIEITKPLWKQEILWLFDIERNMSIGKNNRRWWKKFF